MARRRLSNEPSTSDTKLKDDAVLARLARVEGQIRGIQRMVADGRPCEDVLTQIIAARAALDRAAAEIVTAHLSECLVDLGPEKTRETISQAVGLLSRLS